MYSQSRRIFEVSAALTAIDMIEIRDAFGEVDFSRRLRYLVDGDFHRAGAGRLVLLEYRQFPPDVKLSCRQENPKVHEFSTTSGALTARSKIRAKTFPPPFQAHCALSIRALFVNPRL
jgi:hypothetical protein